MNANPQAKLLWCWSLLSFPLSAGSCGNGFWILKWDQISDWKLAAPAGTAPRGGAAPNKLHDHRLLRTGRAGPGRARLLRRRGRRAPSHPRAFRGGERSPGAGERRRDCPGGRGRRLWAASARGRRRPPRRSPGVRGHRWGRVSLPLRSARPWGTWRVPAVFRGRSWTCREERSFQPSSPEQRLLGSQRLPLSLRALPCRCGAQNMSLATLLVNLKYSRVYPAQVNSLSSQFLKVFSPSRALVLKSTSAKKQISPRKTPTGASAEPTPRLRVGTASPCFSIMIVSAFRCQICLNCK